MANIRIKDLPADSAPKANDKVPIDLGTTRNTTVEDFVFAGRPTATKTEAEVGTDSKKAMTPLTVKQAIDAQTGTRYVPVTRRVNSGDGLSGGQELTGDITLYLSDSTNASLGRADSAVQPTRSINAGTGLSGGGNLSEDRTLSINQQTITSLSRADTAIQAPGGTTSQVLFKNSNAEGDVSWRSVSNVTAVSYSPQTLSDAEKSQARANIDADKVYNSVSDVQSSVINSSVMAIRTNGYSSSGDGGGALYNRVSSEPSHLGKVQSADGAWWEIVIEDNTLPTACVGFFGDPGADRTSELQSLVDGVPDFLRLVFERSDYSFKSITITKSLVLDWNDSTLTVDPERNSTSSAGPAMYFTGSLSHRYAFTPLTSEAQGMTDRISLVTPSDTVNFAAGDYLEITDAAFVPPAVSSGTGYTGRKEMNKVLRVSGSLLYLEKSVEWPYSTTPQVAKITPLVNPGVRNIKSITEIDPGVQYTGSTVLGPHLMCFRFCVSPLVERVVADKFQLHVCQFSVCDKPVIQYCEGKFPFRPTLGGHGYLVQFDRCNNGLSYRNEGTRLRHLTDFTQCYDCISQENVAHAPCGAQYGGHGQGAKRIKSIDDTVHLGGGEFPCGWNSGNPTFAGDTDFMIIRPRAYGRCNGVYSAKVFSFGYLTSQVTIVDPNVRVTAATTDPATYTIGLEVVGATNVKMIGGYLNWEWVNGGHTSDGQFNIRDIETLKSSDVEIINVTALGSRTPNSAIMRSTNTDGVLRVKDCTFRTSQITTSAILITGTSEELAITENRIRGGGVRGISVANEPTRDKRIRDNVFQGSWTTELHGVAGT